MKFSKMENKSEIIKKYLEKYRNLAPQGSTEWLSERKYSVGGSEFGVFSDIISKKSAKTAIKAKIAKNPPEQFKNRYTNWGKIFENITRVILEHVYSTQIYEFGSIPSETVDGTSYSPDGIGVVKKDGNESLVLFEIKSPSVRIPDGTIMPEYYAQVQHGMHTLPDVDFAVFADGLYYKCRYDELNVVNGYDSALHNKIPAPKTVFFRGIIGLYAYRDVNQYIDELYEWCDSHNAQTRNMLEEYDSDSDSEYVDSDDSDSDSDSDDEIDDSREIKNTKNTKNSKNSKIDDEFDTYCNTVFGENEPVVAESCETPVIFAPIMPTLPNGLIDFGSYDIRPFCGVLHKIVEKKYLMYIPKVDNPTDVQIDSFEEFCTSNGYEMIGIVPWKLCVFKCLKVERNSAYYNVLCKNVISNINILRQCLSAKDPETRLEQLIPPQKNLKKMKK